MAPAPITVSDDPEVTVVTSDMNICEGGTTTFTASISGGVGNNAIQWQEEVTSNNWQDISGANALIYTTPVLAIGVYNYRVQIEQDAGCFATSAPNAVIVVADPVVSISSDYTDICDGGIATLTANVSGGTGTTLYQWQSDPGSGWQNIGGETNSTYTTPTLTVGVYPYRVVISQDPGCDIASSQFDLNVTADPSVSVTADDIDICAGGIVTLVGEINGGAGLNTFQWQEEISTNNWQDILG